MTIWRLALRLRVRYLFYFFVTAGICLFTYHVLSGVTAVYIPSIENSSSQTIALGVAGLVTLYLQTAGIQKAMEFYTHNKVGTGRAARVLSRHRDVMELDSSWQTQWKTTKEYCFFNDVIPANLNGLGLLLGIFVYLTQGMGILAFAAPIGFFLIGCISSSYASNHLCDPEVGELYERPQTYDHAISTAKQDRIERALMRGAKEEKEKERKRNRPLPPEKDSQRSNPRKPY